MKTQQEITQKIEDLKGELNQLEKDYKTKTTPRKFPDTTTLDEGVSKYKSILNKIYALKWALGEVA